MSEVPLYVSFAGLRFQGLQRRGGDAPWRRHLGSGADASLRVVRQLGALHRVQEAQLVLHRQHTSLGRDTVSGARLHSAGFSPPPPPHPYPSKPDKNLQQSFRVHAGSSIPACGRRTPNREGHLLDNLFPKPSPRPAFCTPTPYQPESEGFQGSEFRVQGSGFRVQESSVLLPWEPPP